jgi:hypothetical protein
LRDPEINSRLHGVKKDWLDCAPPPPFFLELSSQKIVYCKSKKIVYTHIRHMLGEILRHFKRPLTGKLQGEVADIKLRHADDFMQLEGVQGVGVGLKKGIFTKTHTIEVYLNAKPSKPIKKNLPKKIEGVKVRYSVSGRISAN